MRNKINISLFLISFSIFMYQVCLLRILSISDYYHFAFLIVSIALLGFGISGSFLYFFINKFKDPNFILLFFSFCFSISIVISFIAINLIPFDSFKIAWELRQIFYLAVYYLSLLLPFFFGGSFIGYIFFAQEKPGITYFYNLIGSAAGSLLVIFLIPFISERGVIIASTVIGLAATFILINKRYLKVFLISVVIFLILLSSILLYFPQVMDIRMSPYKSLATVLRYPDSKVIYSGENSYSVVNVIESSSIKSAPGISLKYGKAPPAQLGITIDGDNLSAITKVQEDVSEPGFMEYLPISLLFTAKPYPENVLVIEPGGGLDVLGTLYFDSESVYVVESNSLVVDILEKDFSEFSGKIYNRDNVKIYETSSRNFAKVAPVHFDLIIISLSDSFHPISSGAYSLNENYLYTTQSFKDLIKILKKDGVLAITRWVQFPPSENLKILSTLMDSCSKLDIKEVPSNIFAFRSWSTLTTMFKKDGFLPREISDLKMKIGELNFDIVYYNSVAEDEVNIYNQLDRPYFYDFYKEILEDDDKARENFYDSYYFNISPSIDDRPYFFDFFRFGQVSDIIKYFGKSTQPFGGGGYLILIAALIISIILSILLILFPLRIKRININIRRDYRFLIYFLALGFGYFFIELPFIQKFILILGKPAYSLSVILFSLMLSAGLGSYLSSRFRFDLRLVILILVSYIAVFIWSFPFVSDFIISKDLWQRFLYTILLIMPAGFFMGIPFPTGISKAKQKRKEIIPWLWAVNGCASVIGSIAAVIISIHFGFFVVIGISVLLYILALISYKFC